MVKQGVAMVSVKVSFQEINVSLCNVLIRDDGLMYLCVCMWIYILRSTHLCKKHIPPKSHISPCLPDTKALISYKKLSIWEPVGAYYCEAATGNATCLHASKNR